MSAPEPTTALVKLPDATLQQVNDVLASGREMAVLTRTDYDNATDTRALIKSAQKMLEALRKKAVDPLNKQVKDINAAFKTWTEPLADVDEILERRMLAWFQAEQKRLREEQARVEEENRRRREEAAAEEARQMEAAAEKARLAAEDLGIDDAEADAVAEEAANAVPPVAPVLELAPVQETTTRGVFGTSQVREVWDFEVVSHLEVPREYLTVDETAIRRAVAKGVREISGVRIYQRAQIARR